ncbi:MAG: cache domain-containing protein, partial [bacterium]
MTRSSLLKQRLPVGLIVIFVLLSVGIVSAGYLYYHGYETSHRQEVEKQLIAVGDLKVAELAQWRKERLGDGGIFFRNTAFSTLVGRYYYQPTDLQAQRELESWLSKVLAYGQYDRAFLLDPQGIERLSIPLWPEKVASVLSQRTPEILESGAVTFQDFFRDDQNQRIYLAVLVPILDLPDAGPPLGLLVLRIDPEQYLYPFINRWPTPSPTAETLLVRRDGSDVLYLNELRFQKDTALTLRYSLDRRELPAVKAVLGQKGIVDGTDYRGVSVIADLQPIPNSPWFMVARIDAAEAFGPLVAQLWVMIFLVTALLLCAGAGVGFFWRQQNFRFYR